MIEKAKRTEVFDYAPVRYASCDPAFGGDDCMLIMANVGHLRDGKPCASCVQSMKINVEVGADRMLKEEQIAEQIIQKCREWGVEAKNFIIDCTGQGRGIYEILRQR